MCSISAWVGNRGFTRISRLNENAFSANAGSISRLHADVPEPRRDADVPLQLLDRRDRRVGRPGLELAGRVVPEQLGDVAILLLPGRGVVPHDDTASSSPFPAPCETWTAAPTGYSIA